MNRKRKLDKEASKQVRPKHLVTGASFLEWYLWEGEGKPKLEPRPGWYPLELMSNISPTLPPLPARHLQELFTLIRICFALGA